MTAVRSSRPAPRARAASSRAASSRAASSRAASSRGTTARSASTRSTRSTPSRPRSAVRSLPQETTGPLLRVFHQRSMSLRATLAVGSLLFFAVLAGAVAIQAQRIEAQHRLDRLEQEVADAAARHRDLRASVAIAESPDRVMAEALALGMVEPGPVLPLVSVSPGRAGAEHPTPTDPVVPPVDHEVAAR